MTSAAGRPASARSAEPVGPEQLGGQGLDRNQFASGDRAILAALTEPAIAPQIEFVITYRAPAYEVWSKRGMIRFCRYFAEGGGYRYEMVEQIGEHPIARQEHDALVTVEDELAAAARSGAAAGDGAHAFVAGSELSYPFVYERISQLFDSPDAPDLILHPTAFAAGSRPGPHGNRDVIQSRCPLILSGPGVRPGVLDEGVTQVDIAPTIAHLLRLPLVDGRDITGRTSSQRGVPPDVYLARQDGRVLTEALSDEPARPKRAYVVLLDGLHNGELLARLAQDGGSLPNLRRLAAHGATYRTGAAGNYPGSAWPAHNTIGTGAWCGHHGIVNGCFYRRARREVADPQTRQFETERELDHGVDTLYEAVHIRHGQWTDRPGGRGALTAAINTPCTRGAMQASLERRLIGDGDKLAAMTAELTAEISPRWLAAGRMTVQRAAEIDTRGTAQALLLFSDPEIPPPAFTVHALGLTDVASLTYGPQSGGVRAALEESDRRIGRVLAALDERGLFEETLFVVTGDHGMAAQDFAASGYAADWLVNHAVGVYGVACERFVYLRDMNVTFEDDGEKVIITVRDNDPDESGERQPVAGAAICITDARGHRSEFRTDGAGHASFTSRDDGEIAIQAEGFNGRRVRRDGSEILPDIRSALYGDGAGA